MRATKKRTLSQDLKHYRKNAKSTQASLAKTTGLSVPTIKNLKKNGLGNISSLIKVMEHFDLELVGRNLNASLAPIQSFLANFNAISMIESGKKSERGASNIGTAP